MGRLDRQLHSAGHQGCQCTVAPGERVAREQLSVLEAPGRPRGCEGRRDILHCGVADGMDRRFVSGLRGAGHEFGEFRSPDVGHTVRMLRSELGRIGLAHVGAGRAHGAVGDDFQRPLRDHGGVVAADGRARERVTGAQARCDPPLQFAAIDRNTDAGEDFGQSALRLQGRQAPGPVVGRARPGHVHNPGHPAGEHVGEHSTVARFA